MTEFNLNAKERTEKPKKLRKEGVIPGIIYGNNFSNLKIALSKNEFENLFKEAGTSNLIDLKIDDSKSIKTLIHDIQIDPVKNDVLHVDFLKVNMKEKIQTEIPLKFVGESNAVINLDGSLITSKDSIEVECLPGDLVSEIEVDISPLDDFEKNIKVSDLQVPPGIEILDDPEEIIALVQEPRSEEELEALESEVEENVEAVEVEHKGEEAPAEGEENKEKAKQE